MSNCAKVDAKKVNLSSFTDVLTQVQYVRAEAPNEPFGHILAPYVPFDLSQVPDWKTIHPIQFRTLIPEIEIRLKLTEALHR